MSSPKRFYEEMWMRFLRNGSSTRHLFRECMTHEEHYLAVSALLTKMESKRTGKSPQTEE